MPECGVRQYRGGIDASAVLFAERVSDACIHWTRTANLAIFYKDFEYSRGLVKLGAIESGARAFERPGSLRVTIEPVEE
jgi:hypothetical protein